MKETLQKIPKTSNATDAEVKSLCDLTSSNLRSKFAGDFMDKAFKSTRFKTDLYLV